MELYNYLIVLVVIAIAHCSQNMYDSRLLIPGNSIFTQKMFNEVAKSNLNNSFVLSAWSLLTPLAQLSLGAEGNSHDELIKAIGVFDDKSTKSIFSTLNTNIGFVKGLDLKTINKLYVANEYAISDNYAAELRNIFQSDVNNVDFTNNKQAEEEINTWGTWKNSFNKIYTTDSDFYVSQEKTVKVPTMYRKGKYNYNENLDLNAKILEIPYDGDESALYIILPNDIEGITELKEKLNDYYVLNNALKNLSEEYTEAYIPKFTIESTINLKTILPKIGVKKIFSPGEAKLNKVVKEPEGLYISDAIQKAVIEISEEGAEPPTIEYIPSYPAGYVSTTNMFVANHPFVFMIKSGQTILLNGVFYS